MKKKLVAELSRERRMKVYFGMLCILILLVLTPSAHAAFVDDFEHGNLLGWLVSATGGNGSTGVAFYNGSQMAYVSNSYRYSTSISHDFSYVASDSMSFDMEAAVLSYHEYPFVGGGTTISFLNLFNIKLGSVSLVNTNQPYSLGSTSYLIDGLQHHYSASMADLASLAGLDANNPAISTVSLSFWADCSTTNSNNSATVFFDNVTISDGA